MLSPGTILALGVRSSGGAVVDLAGDLAPSVSFAADLTVTSPIGLAGDLAPSVLFIAADLTVTGPIRNYVDFSGNIGGVSLYGRRAYGRGHYSRIDAFEPLFVGDFDILGQKFFAGDIAPVVNFAGTLQLVHDLGGDLAPQVTFGGNLALVADLSGDLAPQIDFAASLSFEANLDGGFDFTVTFAATELIAKPLWGQTEPCPPPVWGSTDPCSSIMWTPTDPDSIEWEDTELCNG